MTIEEKIQSRIEILKIAGFEAKKISKSVVSIEFKGSTVLYYPRKEWFSGAKVKDGRGFENLMNQLTAKKKEVPSPTGSITQYWLIDKGLFRQQRFVYEPIYVSSDKEECRTKRQFYPNAVMVKTVFSAQGKDKIRIHYQQVNR